MSSNLNLREITDTILELTQRERGLEFFLTYEEDYVLDFKDQKLYLENTSQEVALAIRYLNNKGKTGILYLSSPCWKKLKDAVEHAKVLSEYGQEGVFPKLSCENLAIERKRIDRPTKESLLTLLEEEREILAGYKKITRIEREILSWNRSRIFLIREDRILSEDLLSFGFSLSCIAHGSIKEASAFVSTEAISPERLNLAEMASWCAFKAEALSESRKRDSFKCPVLFPPELATELLNILAFSLNGEEVLKRRSKLADNLGKRIFAEGLTIIDDGVNPELVESRSFDDEGVPQQKTVLVGNGELRSFLWNCLTALKAGVHSTGNARRPDLASPPKVDFTNLYIAPGVHSRDSLLRMEKRVFMVLELLGVHTADPISGDFSFGASGVLYEDGEPTDYLAEMALSGNIFEIFKDLEVGSDLTFFGSLGSPSLLLPPMPLG